MEILFPHYLMLIVTVVRVFFFLSLLLIQWLLVHVPNEYLTVILLVRVTDWGSHSSKSPSPACWSKLQCATLPLYFTKPYFLQKSNTGENLGHSWIFYDLLHSSPNSMAFYVLSTHFISLYGDPVLSLPFKSYGPFSFNSCF